nr:cytochrome c oxidase assembly protein [Candidatus Eremiobacteraeota bacterium]
PLIAALLGLLAIAGYLAAVYAYRRRYPHRLFPAPRIAAFAAGAVIGTIAILPPVDALVDRSFTAHMLQHLVLALVAPPLILLGAPLLLVLALPPAHAGRTIARIVRHPILQAFTLPVVSWLLFAAVLWGIHLSPTYNVALDDGAVHALEHFALVASAMLFWMAVVQVGYAPYPLPFAARMFYLFWAIPQGAFLGLMIYSARHVLYAHYLEGRSAAAALTDQQNAGALMWIGGGGLMFVAFMVTAAAWAAAERTEAAV